MLRRLILLFVLVATITLFLGAASVSQVNGPGDDTHFGPATAASQPGGGGDDDDDDDGEEIPFDDANIFFELNNTDGDLGIHALIDGEPWKLLQIEDPSERKKLRVLTRGTMRLQGLTELFFESAEPTFDEVSPEEFFDRFDEGYWEISGITIEGDELESVSYLSHVMAAPPENIRVNGLAVPEGAVVTSGADAMAEINVVVRVDENTYSGSSLNTDVVEGSAEAFVEALNKTVWKVSSSCQLAVFVEGLIRTIYFTVFEVELDFQLTVFIKLLRKTVYFPVFIIYSLL